MNLLKDDKFNSEMSFGGRSDRTLYWGLLFLVAAVYGTLSFLVPPSLDDFMFLGVWKDHSGGNEDFSWHTWLGYISELRANDNNRLSNILDPIFLQFSPWKQLFPLITGAMVAFTMAVSARFAAIRAPRSSVLAYFLAGIILFLPWRNNMFVWDYSLNYIWTGTFSLGLIRCIFHLNEGRAYFWGAVILAALTGWFHEGFAVPVGTGMVAVALLRRGKVSWHYWTVFAVLVAVCSAALFCPGMLNRFDDQAGRQDELEWWIIFADLCLVLVATLLAAGGLFCREWRRRMATPAFVMFFISMAVGAALSIVVLHQPRSAYWPQLCALISIAVMLRPWLGRLASSMTGRVLAAALAMLTLAQGVTSCVWQYRLKQEFDVIMKGFETRQTLFYDFIMPEDITEFTLRFTTRASWITYFQFRCIDNYFGREGHAVVPVDLKDASEENSQQVPGNLNLRRKGNAMWLPAMTEKEELTLNGSDFEVTLKDGTVRYKRGFAHSFTTDRGDTLVYVKINAYEPRDLISVSMVK